MKTIQISYIARYTLLLCFLIAGIYHTLVVTRFVPYEMAWGGRLNSVEDMYKFEAFSLLVNGLFIWIVLNRVRWGYWAIALIFLLNTAGNLMAINFWEMVIFTPLTAISSLCAFWLALKD